MNDCEGPLHPAAIEGLRLFNQGKFFEAHEELETAWRAEPEAIRSLYQGILQIAVAYLHLTRNNYEGAIKVYGRALRWLRAYPDFCRGVDVGQIKRDAEVVFDEAQRLGPDRLPALNPSLFRPIHSLDP